MNQDFATRRILAVFLAAALILWGMSYIYEVMTFGTTFQLGIRINRIVLAVSGVAAICCFAVYFLAHKRGTFHSERVFNSGFFALCTTVLFACSGLLALDFYHGMHVLYIFLPVTAVLFLVYCIYERQFFTFCMAQALAITAAYTCYAGNWMSVPLAVIAVVLCALLAVVAAGKQPGLLRMKEALFGKQPNVRYALLVYCCTIAMLILAAVLKGKVALLISLALGAYLLACAVYYTVRAM